MILQLKSNEYLIADVEQMDEEPSCYLKNCYRIEEITYYEYSNEERKHVPPADGILILTREETDVSKSYGEIVTTEYYYVRLEKYPKYTKDNEALIYSNKILTISEPDEIIENFYKKTISE